MKENFIVYRDPAYYAGWPHNGGLWQFSDGELLLGFVRGRCDYRDLATLAHSKVDCGGGEHITLRSFDGGASWPLETLQTIYTRPAVDEAMQNAPPAITSEEQYDPQADGYCLLNVFGIPPVNEDGTRNLSLVFISTDRGNSWQPPLRLPVYNFGHLGGRPNYCVRTDGTVLLFAHATRKEQEAGGERTAFPVIYASRNGGASWAKSSEVELQPGHTMGIMPSPLMLPDGTILIAVRRQYSTAAAYTQIYASEDGGLSWRLRSRANLWGAPATLSHLPDGRIVCVYGYRQKPWGIRAAVSADGGHRWGKEIVLRADGSCGDLGYPRTIVRPDGRLVTVYYFAEANDSASNGGVRHISATIWEI